MKKAIQTQDAPAAIGPYSQAIVHNGTVYVSGQLGLDPATGRLEEGVAAQASRALDNIKSILLAAGAEPAAILKATVFMTDLGEFATVNKIMEERLPAPFPARSCVEVSALPKGALVEIEVIAGL